MGQKWTDEELALLTDEEREGLLDGNLRDDDDEPEGDEDAEARAAIEGGTGEDSAGAGESDALQPEGGTDDPAPAEAGGKTEDAGDQPAPQSVPEGGAPAAEQPKRSSGPLPNWEAPKDLEAKLEAIQVKQAELDQKFDDGELTAAELRAENRKLQDEERVLHEAQFKASLSHEAQIARWSNETVPVFFAEHGEIYTKSETLYKALDLKVRELQANSADPFDPTILGRAHEAVQADIAKALGITPAAPTPARNPATPAAPAAPREIPPTLAHVPASEIEAAGDGGKFAVIDRLEGEEYEAAIGKMSDAELAAYLAR